MNIDELIEKRNTARMNRDWRLSDEIRDILDSKLVFVFDGTKGDEIFYLTEDYFKHQHKLEETKNLSKRKYVEFRIKQDIQANDDFDAWLYTINSKQ